RARKPRRSAARLSSGRPAGWGEPLRSAPATAESRRNARPGSAGKSRSLSTRWGARRSAPAPVRATGALGGAFRPHRESGWLPHRAPGAGRRPPAAPGR
nr:hypothetical protein [Tanacetum cinerariifolium]